MELFSFWIMILGLSLEVALLVRAARGRFLSQFPLFYSYLAYVLCWNTVAAYIYFFMNSYYPSVYWFCYTMMLVAEFAVILEVSDHIFEPFPAIRSLGRLLTACICLVFVSISVVPSMMQPQTSSHQLLQLTKTASLAKALLIIALLGAVRLYRLPLGKHTSGMLLGFATYLSLHTANHALAQSYGRAAYAHTMGLIGSLGFILALTIWNIALWHYQPVSSHGYEAYQGAPVTMEPLAGELGRYNNALERLWRR